MRMMRKEDGFTLVELMVSMSVMLLILAAVVAFNAAANKGSDVLERQSQFAKDVSSPMHVMDKAISQNVKILSSFTDPNTNITYTTTNLQSNTLVVRGPINPDTRKYKIQVFSAHSDRRLTENRFTVDSVSGTVARGVETVWSESVANVPESVPLFQIRDASNVATVTAAASNVVIKIVTSNTSRNIGNTDDLESERVVYFRNR